MSDRTTRLFNVHWNVSPKIDTEDKLSDEVDPFGADQHTPGAKLDAGKNRLGLVLLGFSRSLQEVGRVGTYGAQKYTPDGWVSVPDGGQRYTDAMLRHLMREGAGEQCDPDTQILHAAHVAWNALARLDLALRAAEPEKKPAKPRLATVQDTGTGDCDGSRYGRILAAVRARSLEPSIRAIKSAARCGDVVATRYRDRMAQDGIIERTTDGKGWQVKA